MIIGIDLGTSNSLVTYWDNEKAIVIPNEFGERLTPSVVSVSEDQKLLVGAIAKERLFTHPNLTAATFKRFIGTKKTYQLGNWTLTPIELSSLVLKQLKNNAEIYFSEPVNEAIISVPAYFNSIQRQATLEAANLAGLEVKGLISEPTAAAIAYGVGSEDDQLILVCDLGGGTYDVSLIELFDGIMQVEAISGDMNFGGEDFTNLIYQDILLKNSMTKMLPMLEERAIIHKIAEEIKVKLETQSEVNVEFTLQNNIIKYDLSYETYEKLCEELLIRIREPLLKVFKDSQKQLADIDKVILVGGATKAKVVKDFITKLLKKFPFYHFEADEIVGLGVGIQGSLKNGNILKEELMLTDVCAHTMGVDTMVHSGDGYIDGVYQPIIERNSPIPISKEYTFYTIYDNQIAVKFNIYQGEYPKVVDNLKIGELELQLKKVPKNYPIKCRFTYDLNGILEVLVTDLQSNNSVSTVIEENPGTLTKEEIKVALSKLEELKIHPKEKAINQLLLAQLDRLYVENIGEERIKIGLIRHEFEMILESQNEKLISRKQKEIKLLLDQEKNSSVYYFDN